jgi:PAS domain S-box-containing protein
MSNFDFKYFPKPILWYDVNTLKILEVNEALTREYGYSREELLTMNLYDLRPEEDFEKLEKIIAKIKEGVAFEHRVRHKKKNGEIVDVEVCSNLVDHQGRQTEFVIITDISKKLENERKVQEANETLAKSERRFKALVQDTAEFIAIMDKDFNITFLSDNYIAMHGYVPAELMGRKAFSCVHPEDLAALEENLAGCMSINQVNIKPFRFLNREKEWRWVTGTATNLLEDPAVKGLVVNTRDITEVVIKTRELNLSNERYQLALKASGDAIVDWDIEKDETEWGKNFQEIFGYDVQHYSKTLWSDNVYEEDKPAIDKLVNEYMEDPSREVIAAEYRFYKANRDIAVVQFRGVFLRDENGKAIRLIGSFRDITNYKDSQYELQRKNKQLQDIAWTQAHKVRAALSKVMGLVHLMQAEEENLTEGQKELLEHLGVSAAELDEVMRMPNAT